ncbi:unnamed protein product [Spirodela intermedia]|uniref:Aspergillus nuclease S1 n=1 Tax=Spirodela intermedia TaxID=51605 RepID=A0A7I8JFA1_SPIIN|nr:unnamed protein product [Spirodela intermedia]CAA6668799.1 unnamed protein product [Spirodela intermedia]
MARSAVSARTWALILVLLFLLPGALPWGKEGHYAICKIAEGLLSEGAQASVKKLLPTYAGGNLSALCSWADQIRHNFRWRWTGPLHYIDTPDFACNYGYCHRCVAGAIYNYSAQLSASPGLNSQHGYNLTEALLFLSHFMGDIHQPLHVGFAGDEGGNTIIVRWFRRKTNLHHVWDTMIIESALKKFHGSDLSSMIQAIRTKWTRRPAISSWVNCASNETVCPDTHASESVGLACRYAYRNVTPGATLGDEYFLSRLPLVEKRLAQAGARLAATLNSIFTAGRPPPPISSPIEPLCREWGQG